MCGVCKDALFEIQKGEEKYPIVLHKFKANLFLHNLTTQQNRKGEGVLSQTTYGWKCSALCHIYQMSGEEIIASFKRYIVKFLGGMIRTVAKGGNESGESLNEGKKLMIYNLYNKLCEMFFQVAVKTTCLRTYVLSSNGTYLQYQITYYQYILTMSSGVTVFFCYILET